MHKRIFFLGLIGLLLFGLPAAPGFGFPPVQREVLPNGMVLLTAEEHSLPFLTIQLLIKAGSGKDPSGEEGLARMTAKGLLFGSASRSAKTLNEELDYMGASLDSSAGRDYATLSLRVMKKDLEKGMALFIESLTRPNFPDEEIRREVQKTLAAIRAREDRPEEVAEKAFEENLYVKGPYKHPIEGTQESVTRIGRDAVIRFYRNYYSPANCILAVVGDITREEVRRGIIAGLQKWSGEKKGARESKETVFLKDGKTVTIERPLTQANVILGQSGVRRENPDYYALTVMNFILGGGGFSSRLLEEIRNKRGLAYYVGSHFDPGKEPGSFQVVLQTKNASVQQAVDLAKREIEKIRREKVSEKELAGAHKYLVGSFPMRFDTQGKLSNFLIQMEYYGLGLDYPEKYPRLIESVDADEVLRVARKYLHPEESLLVIVADLKEAGLSRKE